jgi:hypothetical protein
MPPKWFRRVRELFQDGFVAGFGDGSGAQFVRKALKKWRKSRRSPRTSVLIGSEPKFSRLLF